MQNHFTKLTLVRRAEADKAEEALGSHRDCWAEKGKADLSCLTSKYKQTSSGRVVSF